MSSTCTPRSAPRLTAPAAPDTAGPAPAQAGAFGRFLTSHGLSLIPATGGFTLTDLQAGTAYDHGSSQDLADGASVLAMRQALRSARAARDA